MKNKATIAACAIAACLGAGCVLTPQPPLDTRVTLAQNLGESVYVTDVRCARNATGYLRLQANVVNLLSKQNLVEYKVAWLDASGMEIDSVMSTWQATALQANEIRGLQATAPNPEAVDMRIYVRQAK